MFERAWVRLYHCEHDASTIVICYQTARQIVAPRKTNSVERLVVGRPVKHQDSSTEGHFPRQIIALSRD